MDSTILLLYTLLQVCACWVSTCIFIFFIFKSGELGAKSRSKQDWRRKSRLRPASFQDVLSFCKNHLDFEHLTHVNSFGSFDCTLTHIFDYSYIFDIVEDVSLLFKHLSIAYREGFFYLLLTMLVWQVFGQDVSLAFKTWTSGKPESWFGEALKVGSVGAQQRWCFVDGWEFQATNIFWMADAASPLGQLNITLTCPDAGKMMSRFRKVLEVRMPKTTNVWFQHCFIEKWFQDFPRKKQYVCKFHWKSTPFCKTCNDTLGHQISCTLMTQDEIVAAKGALSDAHTMGQTAAAKEKEVHLISLQELAKSNPQQAASKGLAEGMIHSEALRETAKALLDSEVQSKFHQIQMASHVFMIIPLVHTSTSRGSHALGEEVVNLINGGSLEWKHIKEEMQAAISHSGGSDIIAFENVPTKSRKFPTTMEKTTMQNFKAAAGTAATKVKVHVMDQLNMYNLIQLKERKYIFLPLIAAILVIPLLVALGCQFDKSQRLFIDCFVFPISIPLLQAFCIFGPPTAAHFGLVDCGVGVPWELHTAFAVLVAAYAFSSLADAMNHRKDYFQGKANGKMCEWMCECCPPLPYCGFEVGQRQPVPKKGMTLRVDDVNVIIIPNVGCGILKSNNLTCLNMFQVDID